MPVSTVGGPVSPPQVERGVTTREGGRGENPAEQSQGEQRQAEHLPPSGEAAWRRVGQHEPVEGRVGAHQKQQQAYVRQQGRCVHGRPGAYQPTHERVGHVERMRHAKELGGGGGGGEGRGERERSGKLPDSAAPTTRRGRGSADCTERELPQTVSGGSPTANGSTQGRRTANAGKWRCSSTAGPKITTWGQRSADV
jgi:hypothetical protein